MAPFTLNVGLKLGFPVFRGSDSERPGGWPVWVGKRQRLTELGPELPPGLDGWRSQVVPQADSRHAPFGGGIG